LNKGQTLKGAKGGKCGEIGGRKNNKNMICTCKYYITLSSVELFKVL
jgi:hypothetical protein